MQIRPSILVLSLAVLAAGCGGSKPLSTAGRLTLDPAASSLSAVAIKNEKVPVTLKFPVLTGWAEASGQADLEISLGALQTGDAARDKNLKDLFFELGKQVAFGTAQFKLEKLDPAVGSLVSGQSLSATASGSLSLHGASIPLSGPVSFSRKGHSLTVTLGEGWSVAIDKTSLVEALKNLNQNCPQPHHVGNSVKIQGSLVFKG